MQGVNRMSVEHSQNGTQNLNKIAKLFQSFQVLFHKIIVRNNRKIGFHSSRSVCDNSLFDSSVQ